jgi:hypothetical protein
LEQPKPDVEESAFLEVAQQIRSGLMHRDELIRPFRDRFDRSQDDPRVLPDQRNQIAIMFLRATYKADHVYEDHLRRARELYGKLRRGDEERG